MRTKGSSESSSFHFRVEIVISDVLRWGVLASMVLILLGTVLCFLHSHDYGTNGGTAADLHRLIRPEAATSFSMAPFVHGLFQMQGQSIIVAGLLLLIATPVLRVAISVVTFIIEKDWTYVVITAIVLIQLLFSLFSGKGA